MQYFLIHVVSGTGPGRWPIAVSERVGVAQAVGKEARRRGVIICNDYRAETISAAEYLYLTGGRFGTLAAGG